QLPRRSPDSPGGKGMAEAVRMNVGDPRLLGKQREDDVHVAGAQGTALDGLEERPGLPTAKCVEIGTKRLQRNITDRSPALLAALALQHAHAMILEQDVGEFHG